MNIIKITNKRLTKDEAAKALGLQTYDTALPQTWVDNLLLHLALIAPHKGWPEAWSDLILSGLVWCYRDAKGEPSLFGYPVALTVQVLDMLTSAKDIWDTKQDAVIETRETFVIDGNQLVRDAVMAEDQEQAEMMFHLKYPGVKITEFRTRDQFNHK